MQTEQEICLPNIGDFDQVDVVEIHVSEGDTINTDDPILSLESEKATMDIPAPSAGTVKKLLINIGDKIAEGAPLLLLEVSEETDTETNSESVEQTTEKETTTDTSTESLVTKPEEEEHVASKVKESAPSQAEPSSPPAQIAPQTNDGNIPHASPSVRRFARELGVDLNLVTPSGPKKPNS